MIIFGFVGVAPLLLNSALEQDLEIQTALSIICKQIHYYEFPIQA